MTRTRELALALDKHAALPDTWRVTAECPDEITEIVLMNPIAAGLEIPAPDDFAASSLARAAREEHLGACPSCAKWSADA